MVNEINNSSVYSFDDQDAQYFQHAGNILSSLQDRRDAIADAQSMILRLYFQDQNTPQ